MGKIFYFVIVILLTLSSCISRSGLPSELIGDWYAVKGDVEVYSMTIENGEGIYLGTIDDRPMVKGKWKVENGFLVLIPESEGQVSGLSRYTYRIDNDTLWLNHGQEIFTKTLPLKVKHPETSILENIRSDFRGRFTEPSATEVPWDDGTSYSGFSIEMISDTVSVLYSEITTYLQDKGFEPDEKVITEICNGYVKNYGSDTIVVMVCFVTDEDGSPAGIKISAALNK